MYNKPAVTDPASPEIILSSLSNGFPKMRIPRADIESSQEKETSISFRKISQACGLGSPQDKPAIIVSKSPATRSEEHTSELQSRGHLVCRLLLEKKKDYT